MWREKQEAQISWDLQTEGWGPSLKCHSVYVPVAASNEKPKEGHNMATTSWSVFELEVRAQSGNAKSSTGAPSLHIQRPPELIMVRVCGSRCQCQEAFAWTQQTSAAEQVNRP